MTQAVDFDAATGSRAPSTRIAGLDVVRAVALIGVVVMNYHGYLILDGAPRGDSTIEQVFDPWTGPLSTRFAATFVLVAGVGVSLMTARVRAARSTSDEIVAMRWRFVRRGVVLYVIGQLVEQVWRGTILVYYGAMFVLAAGLFRLRDRTLAAIGFIAVAAAWSIRAWVEGLAERGERPDWLLSPEPGSWQDRVFEVAVNGTHPLLPWLAFFCAGIVLGRHLGDRRWTVSAIVVGASAVVVARSIQVADRTAFQEVLLSDDPFDRGGVYVASALGSALVATVGIMWLVDRTPLGPTSVVGALARAGQMSLTIYLLHVGAFILFVDWLDVVQPDGLGTALAFAAAFWLVAVIAAAAWQRRFGRGPAEAVYRRLGG